MAAKTPPAFTKGQMAVIVGWDSRIPGLVTADSDKTHTMFLPHSAPFGAKPWKVLNTQLQAA